MKSTRKDKVLIDKQNRRIPICSWLPNKTSCQLVVVHGFSEHMWYYHDVAKTLSESGVAVHMMDLPGHGMAEGIRGHIDRFDEYLDNVDLLWKDNPFYLKTKPTFILGHSLGGLISAQYVLRRTHTFQGLILTSPLTGFGAISSLPATLLASLLAKNHRNDPIPKPAGVKALSRNPNQWPVYLSDPCRGRMITPNLYLLMLSMSGKLQEYASSIKLPILMFVSEKDKVVDPYAGQRFFGNVGSSDKKLIVFSEAMHELFQEVECGQILETMQVWINDRI
ncbi:MAG: lysophospholipase [Proteobacteria bacterium]|nr:lysophospholipase [Pseudomonadota bacterium]